MKKATYKKALPTPVRAIARTRSKLHRLQLICAGIAAVLLLSAANSKAVTFFPDGTFLDRINIDEDANFGATGVLNSTVSTANSVTYNVTFGTSGVNEGVNVANSFYSSELDLSAYTDTEVNTEVLSGAATVVLFLQDGSANFNFVQANGPNGQDLASGVLPLDYQFQAPFVPGKIVLYGFAFFGAPGTSATIEITPTPEPSTIALLTMGALGGWTMVRRRKGARVRLAGI
jgi:spore coat protein U-like protein